MAFWVDTREECLRAADLFLDNDVPIEAAPSKHAIAQGFFLYGLEPGWQPRRGLTTGGYFVFDPDVEPVVWSGGRAPQGPGLGRQDGRQQPPYDEQSPDVAKEKEAITPLPREASRTPSRPPAARSSWARSSKIGLYVIPLSLKSRAAREQVAWRETAALFYG